MVDRVVQGELVMDRGLDIDRSEVDTGGRDAEDERTPVVVGSESTVVED